jgi:RNA polymerase sigma factor (sigma-70 family)
MPKGSLGTLLHYVGQSRDAALARDLTDAELLERFLNCREEVAFALLVQRHGPMVLGLCRRVLGDVHAAEDAFQATFLVLVQRAAAIRRRGSLGSWLYGVARRVAVRARRQAAARVKRERDLAQIARVSDMGNGSWRELRAIVDEELGGLPDKYRAPVVLCKLEAKSYEQAATELGWPKHTLAKRLRRGLDLLRERLTRRGLTLPAGGLAMALGNEAGGAPPAALLTIKTVKAASRLAAGECLADVILSEEIRALVVAAARPRQAQVVIWALALMVALGGVGLALCGWLFEYDLTLPTPQVQAPTPKSDELGPNQATDQYGDPLPAGAVARLGTVRWRHGGGVGFAQFLPDGKRVLSVGNDRAIRLWEYPSGKEIRRFGQPETDEALDWKSGQAVRFCDHAKVSLTADGKTVALSFDDAIQVYEVSSGKRLATLPADSPRGDAPAISFSPDGRHLAALEGASLIRLWDWAAGKEIRKFKCPFKGPESRKGVVYNQALAFSPGGQVLAATMMTRDGDASVILWDPDTGKELRSFATSLDNDEAGAPVFTPDGKTLAFARGKRGWISLVETSTGKEIRRLHDKDQPPRWPLTFNQDGTKLYCSIVYRSQFQEWDVATGTLSRTLGEPHGNNPHVSNHAGLSFWISLSPDGKTAALADGWRIDCHRLTFLELASGKTPGAVDDHAQPILGLHFTPDGKHVVAQGDFRTADVWDAATGKLVHAHTLSDKEFVWISDVSPDGSLAAIQTADSLGIDLLELRTGKVQGTIPSPPERPDQGRVAFAPDGKTLAVVWPNAKLLEWFDVASRRRLYSYTRAAFEDGQRQPATMIFSPDGKTLAAYLDPQTFAWFDVASGKRLGSLRPPRDTAIRSGAFSADGRSLVLDMSDGTAVLYELATAKPRRTYGKRLTSLPAGHATGLPGIRQFPGGDAARRVALTPDGKTLALAGHDRKVHLYNVFSGEEIGSLSGHSAAILAIAISPDGTRLASASADTTVLLWDLSKVGR